MTVSDGGTWLGMPAGPGHVPDGAAPTDRLRADCSRCFALCCVALPFAASADFAIDKPAGRPCVNLGGDNLCGIHSRLRQAGFPGCTVYDCFGAGQRVSRQTFGGRSWRGDPDTARRMFAVFPVVRQLHEMLRHLAEAANRAPTAPLRARAADLFGTVDALAGADPETLAALDVDAHRPAVGSLLARVSEAVRGTGGRALRHADLVGANLARADLYGADLRGAQLIAADLTGADLRVADLLGADLRDADLSGADLTDALFLTQPQLDAARGDGATRLPPSLARPGHWEQLAATGPGRERRRR
ncbi:pentapeptide repeat-containing protein [Georgenia daeguensis]|uniref:Pentapeptide repeat-containing protein n=1 Tax=Georgenia daeguensis TaxID=908355 RepID=A0ABP8EUF7_9MICO